MLLAQRLCPCCSAWKLLSHKVTWPAPWLTSAEPTEINPLHGNYHLMTYHLHLLVYFIISLALAGMLFVFHCCTPSIHQNAWLILKVQSMFVEWMKNWCHITSFGSSRKLLSLSVLCEVLPDGHILNGIVFGFSTRLPLHTNSVVRVKQWNLTQFGMNSGSDGKASAYNVGDPGSIPGSGSSPGEGNGNLLQYSCLENPTDGGVR